MSEVERVWREKSDGRLLEAFRCIDQYDAEAQAAIRGEFARRGLAEPVTEPVTFREADKVARLHRRFAFLVGAQWLALLAGATAPRSALGSVLEIICLATYGGTLVAIPIAGYMLFTRLGLESPRAAALFTVIPLFSVLAVLGMRTFNQRWGAEHGVEVGLLGPTRDCQERLRAAESSERSSERGD